MKHLTEKKRREIAKPLDEAIPKINKILEEHGLQDFRVSEISLAGVHDRLVCKPGYHEETYCDELGRCYSICKKDIPPDDLRNVDQV
jgi:hypothetical protein